MPALEVATEMLDPALLPNKQLWAAEGLAKSLRAKSWEGRGLGQSAVCGEAWRALGGLSPCGENHFALDDFAIPSPPPPLLEIPRRILYPTPLPQFRCLSSP